MRYLFYICYIFTNLKIINMKKVYILLSLSFYAFILQSQTIVSTQPQLKNAVLEEFTGINCQYCPQGHALAQLIQDANPTRVTLINIHVGGYATPSAGQPDYRTNFGTSLVNQSGMGQTGTGYPGGTVNRHLFPGYGMGGHDITLMSRTNWNSATNMIHGMDSPVNIGFTSTYNSANRELTVYVELYYTGNSPTTTNYINVALLQSNIVGYQNVSGTGNPNYVHMHMLRHLITGQWGDAVSTTTAGTLVTKTYTYSVPTEYSYLTSTAIPVVIANCEIAVFVTEGQQEITTGVRAPLDGGSVTSMEEINNNKITTLGYNYPNPCSNYTIIPLSNCNKELTFQIVDLTGRIVYEQMVATESNALEINTSTLEKGMYFYRISDNNKVIASKTMLVIR